MTRDISRFKRPTRKEMFFLFAAVCLLVAPEFIMRVTILNTMALVELVVLLLLASSLVVLLWFFYRIFLKGPLRARRINQIREDRMMRELAEEPSQESD